MASTSTMVLRPPKGNFSNRSRRNKNSRKPETPMAPQHIHFSIDSPFPAHMGGDLLASPQRGRWYPTSTTVPLPDVGTIVAVRLPPATGAPHGKASPAADSPRIARTTGTTG